MTELSIPPTATVPVGEYRTLMAGFPTGVAVVTTMADGAPRGMTCSSLCSVTLTPPTLLVCLRSASQTLAAVLGRGGFAVNLLDEHAVPIAQLFASGAPDKFDRVTWRLDQAWGGPRLPAAAHAAANCHVVRTDLVGDHVVVFGEVDDLWWGRHGDPLLYGRRRYAAWPGGDSE
jgi:flavin reductase (DIM6/NTAB) family NADH-FMN oxidoreductase RutF